MPIVPAIPIDTKPTSRATVVPCTILASTSTPDCVVPKGLFQLGRPRSMAGFSGRPGHSSARTLR